MYCFWQLAGVEDRLVLLPLPPSCTPLELDARTQKAVFGAALKRFERCDAGSAKCFHERDRQQLLGVIESGFGSVEHFNERMRTVFSTLLQAKYMAWENWSKA